MVTQVLINKQGIECRRIKTCEEHPHDNQQVDFFTLYPLRKITVIVLKALAINAVVRTEEGVIIAYGLSQKLFGTGVHGRHIEPFIHNIAYRIRFFGGSKREDGGDLKRLISVFVKRLLLKLVERLVIQLGGIYATDRKHGIKACSSRFHAVRLLAEVIENILRNFTNTLRVQ